MRKMIQIDDNQLYRSDDGWCIERELFIGGRSGHWVLYNSKGEKIDRDQFRYDLAERHNIHLMGD